MPVAEVSLGLNRQCKHAIDVMVNEGVLTDAVILPLTTVAGLRAVSSASLPETALRFYEIFQKWVDKGQAIGVLTDAAVAAADTVAGLRALFTANDPTLAAVEQFSFVD